MRSLPIPRRGNIAAPIILVGLAVAIHGCAYPDFATAAQPLGPEGARVLLPVFSMPQVDLDKGNGIDAVFVEVTGDRAEITIVWKDEDYPLPLIDELYGLIRWFTYHRFADTQSLDLEYTGFGGQTAPVPDAINLGGIYTRGQPYGVFVATHHSATVPYHAFQTLPSKNGRPRVFVNTWNHLMSEVDTNPGMSLVDVASYPVYKGSSADVQQLFDDVWPW